jgi:CHRD domain
VKRQAWLRLTLLPALALTAGLALVRPHTLWAQGTPKLFLALATGSQETPPVDTPGVALALFTLTADHKLNYEIHVTGLKGKFAAMHLHRGKAGVAGPVIYPITTPFDTNNVTKGALDFKPEDEADLASQNFYFNIHTDLFGGGETRGQVVPSPVNVQVVNP